MTKLLKERQWKEKDMASVAVAKENKEIALNGAPKDNVRQVTRAAISTMKTKKRKGKRKKSNAISFPETAKVPRAKDHKRMSPSGKINQPACYKFMQGKCTNSSCEGNNLPGERQ